MFNIYNGRDHFWQWDSEQKLVVADINIPEVHFCGGAEGEALVCEVYTEADQRVVNVPNILLQRAGHIRVYAYQEDHTRHQEAFKIVARSRPADYVYNETEVKRWDKVVEEAKEEAARAASGAINDSVTEVTQAVQEAQKAAAAAADSANAASYSSHSADIHRNDAVIAKEEATAEADRAKQEADRAESSVAGLQALGIAGALKGEATGVGALSLHDVDALPHSLKVKLDSDIVSDLSQVKLLKYGKNIFKYDFDAWTTIIENGVTRYVMPIPRLPFAEITVSGVFTSDTLPEAYVYVEKSNDGWATKQYASSRYTGFWVGTSMRVPTFTVEEGYEYRLWTNNGAALQSTVKQYLADVQMEVGSTATEPAVYIPPTEHVVGVDGTADIAALSPHTTLVADPGGVSLTALYHRDVNRAFAELTAAVLATGGNI